ncbi:MAG: TetR/AcrR family transcriptional regulator [Pseudomonadota bacterium]
MSNKDKILAAASELLLEKGLDALSVRAISQRAGLSTIAIYSHFQGKQGVLDELYAEGFALVRNAVLSVSSMDDPVEAALASGKNYLDIALHNEGHYRLIFGETGGGYTPSDEAAAAAREAFEALVMSVTRLLPDESSRALRQRAALRLWAILHGYVSLRHHVIGTVLDYRQWQDMTLEAFRLAVEQINRSEHHEL